MREGEKSEFVDSTLRAVIFVWPLAPHVDKTGNSVAYQNPPCPREIRGVLGSAWEEVKS